MTGFKMFRLPAADHTPAGLVLWGAMFALLSPFGVALQPLAPLAWIQILCLYQFARISYKAAPTASARALSLLFSWLMASTGWSIGNAGLFSFHGFDPKNLISVWILSTVVWLFIIVLGFLPAAAFEAKYPHSLCQPLIFPVCLTTVFYLIGLSPLGTFGNPAYMFLDLKPLALSASFLGVHGTCFIILCAVSGVAYVLDPRWPGKHDSYLRFNNCLATAFLLLLTVGSALEYNDGYFQKSIRVQEYPMLQASCVLRTGFRQHFEASAAMLEHTAARITAGDDIILWSEVALIVTPKQEAELLTLAGDLLKTAKPSTLLGVTYALNLSTPDHHLLRNMYVLMTPGQILWKYQKSHPVPVAEAGVEAGPAVLPVAKTAFGTVAGAVCFDMDSNSFMKQAAQHKVDIVLQPSNTWGPIGQLHFRDNALRAVENGFVLFRCSANSFSGVVSPYFDFVSHIATTENKTYTFSIPTYGHRTTVYSLVGSYMEWALVLLAVALWALVVLPPAWVQVISKRLPPAVPYFILGPRDDAPWVPHSHLSTPLLQESNLGP